MKDKRKIKWIIFNTIRWVSLILLVFGGIIWLPFIAIGAYGCLLALFLAEIFEFNSDFIEEI